MSRMFTLRTVLVCGTIALAATTVASAQTTWHIDDDAPGDPGPGDSTISDPLEDGSAAHPFDAIQEGINAAINGDTVLVADGTYTGTGNKDLDLAGRLITARSANGPDVCIIDCQGAGRGFYFHTAETAAAVVQGFTVTNGSASGIRIEQNSSPTVRNCVFRDCWYLSGAGGALVSTSGPPVLFEHCTFVGNSTGMVGRGGGMWATLGNVILVDCVFRENSSGVPNGRGGGLAADGWVTLTNCQFIQNSSGRGGGIDISSTSQPLETTLTNCTFVGNHAANYGGGLALWNGYAEKLYVINCTFAGNGATAGRSVAVNGQVNQIRLRNSIFWESDAISADGCLVFEVSYSDVLGGWAGYGSNNVDADPLFVQTPDPGPDGEWGTDDDDHGDLHLRPGSPCIDAAHNTYVPADTFDLDGDRDTSERMPFDLGGNPRFVDDPHTPDTGVADPPTYPQVVDMGAYEFQAIPGDLNGDFAVDLDDFVVLAACVSGPDVSPSAGCNAADLTMDNDVDLADFADFQRRCTGPPGN